MRNILIQLAGVEARLLELGANRAETIVVLDELIHSLEELMEYRDMYDGNACAVRLSAAYALMYEMRQQEAEARGDLEQMVFYAQGRLAHLRQLRERRPDLFPQDRVPAAA